VLFLLLLLLSLLQIFLWNSKRKEWAVDRTYEAYLDHHWDLAAVKRIAHDHLRKLNHDQWHVSDDGTEHPHRYSIVIAADQVEWVMEAWRKDLAAVGVEVRGGLMGFRRLKL
jgi:hypothetical protein